MSKWIDKNLFDKYVENKEKEQENTNKTFIKRTENVWQTPAAGTATQPEIYEGRFLPDPENVFTSKYYYHMWKSGDKWHFAFCQKTWDFNNYCPVCSVTNKLYMGTSKDKSLAGNMKRKVRHVSNFYIVSDPRDSRISEPEKKATGKNKIYEFPDKVDAKIKLQLLDKNEGLGSDIFDPGDDGHNFILRIKSTKPDANGKTYPDYSDSDFSRKSSAIGTDKQIKDIMEKRYNLNTYIKSLETSKEQIVEILKSEMLYELVKDELQKTSLPEEKEVKEVNVKKVDNETPVDKKEELDVPDSIGDDDDLLRELENMK
jgi:hypothetical protein